APSVFFPHVPEAQFVSHAPSHGVSQHTELTQWAFAQSSSTEHADPSAPPQTPPTHESAALHSTPAPAHALKQVPFAALHRYAPQSTVMGPQPPFVQTFCMEASFWHVGAAPQGCPSAQAAPPPPPAPPAPDWTAPPAPAAPVAATLAPASPAEPVDVVPAAR